MEVIGMNRLIDSVLILMSPGSFPNQPNSQGANWSVTPSRSRNAPRIMNHFAIFLAVHRCPDRCQLGSILRHYSRRADGTLHRRTDGLLAENAGSTC